MRSWLILPLTWTGLIPAAGDPPVRLGAPAPDWAVETADGRPGSLPSFVRQHKRDAVLLVPRAGEAIPRQDIERARKKLAERDADLLAAPSRPDAERPGFDPTSPATLLVDSGGIVRRIETGRILNGKDLEDFLDQWRLGRGVFLSACARCHGADGSLEVCGDVRPLAGIGNRLTPAQVYERLRVGELSQHEVLVRGRFYKRPEIEAVVVFVRGLQRPGPCPVRTLPSCPLWPRGMSLRADFSCPESRINLYSRVMKPILLAVLAVSPLLADCPTGKDRKPTPAELAFQKKAIDAMASVFPEAPEGFVKPDVAALAAQAQATIPSLCSDSPIGSFRISLTGTYSRASRVDPARMPEWAAVREVESKIESLKQFPPDLDAKYKALQAEMSAASSASRKAQRAQDNETAKAQRAIADAKYAEMTALEEAHKRSTKVQLDAFYAQRSKLVSEINAKYTDQASFTIEINQRPFDAEPDRADVFFFGKTASGLRIHSVSAQLVAHPVTRAMFTVDKARLSALVGLQ